jgi:hypothetical protein
VGSQQLTASAMARPYLGLNDLFGGWTSWKKILKIIKQSEIFFEINRTIAKFH